MRVKHEKKMTLRGVFALLLAVVLLVPMAGACIPVAFAGAGPGDSAAELAALASSGVYGPKGVTADDEFRAVWVATVLNLDYPSKQGLSSALMRSEATAILDNCRAMGFNAVILQVRPSGDALYKSQYFPWSQYLTGSQGTAPGDGFDPLQFWVEEAHARGMELHAWLNPFRV
ncbi:family 10 glycosylhydrolase, partial [Oscillospiraceae bacterium OttesenSCG-928-F05]|nr:family 10 glycosylhydrolase [Oscillospiraceae bacterium OttesenSCG-928-F05]